MPGGLRNGCNSEMVFSMAYLMPTVKFPGLSGYFKYISIDQKHFINLFRHLTTLVLK